MSGSNKSLSGGQRTPSKASNGRRTPPQVAEAGFNDDASARFDAPVDVDDDRGPSPTPGEYANFIIFYESREKLKNVSDFSSNLYFRKIHYFHQKQVSHAEEATASFL